MIIKHVTVNGKKGVGTFVDENFNPVEEAAAALFKVVFDDGGQLILSAHDWSKE